MVEATSPELHELADVVGVARHWRDVGGSDREVADETLATVLKALGHRTESSRQILTSLAELSARNRCMPPMVVTEAGSPTPLCTRATSAEVTGAAGITERVTIDGALMAPIDRPGYYDLAVDGHLLKMAVAPRRCPFPDPHGRRMWGTAVQIPSLRDTCPRPFGGFGELAAAGQMLGRAGCDALAINPVHALFPGVGDDYSPYSPSSRRFLNTAMGDPALLGLPALPQETPEALIDWPRVLPRRLGELRRIFAGLDAGRRSAIRRASQAEGAALRRHAIFDALDCHFRPRGAKDCRDWPVAFRDPDGSAVAQFAHEHPDEINFHLFAQWLSREGLDAAQRLTREAGMAIGLIADLAVGVHSGGSDTWAMPAAKLLGLTIGAPPDPLGPLGQNWSITGFSPSGLRESGYEGWIAMLRSALRSAGGLRIDHAFGLARLWVIPEGEDSAKGAYLAYPFLDLVRLVALEAHLASALIIAEDLGTSPPGFTSAVSERNMLGMRVLWFERAADHGFIGAHDYPLNSVAMTGTHDTPTVAGWWSGRDLDWASLLGRLPEGIDRARADEIRDWDRGLLWSTIGDGGQRPAPDNPQPVVDAALCHVAKSAAVLAIVPIEDLLGEPEQPNLPGTVSEHPNWRQRLHSSLQELLGQPKIKRRLEHISKRN